MHLELNNIKKSYGTGKARTEALRGLTLAVNHGEFVAITGPSGSGKSTLMQIIGLLDNDYQGEFLFNGQNTKKMSDGKRAELRNTSIGFVFQQFNLMRRATVLQNVMLPNTYAKHRVTTTRAMELIEQVGLIEHINHKSNELSGGQMQRVAIARALLMNPTLILADEPTGNLDSSTAAEILSLLSEINSDGHTVLVITHDHDVAQAAGREIRIHDGVLAEGALV